VCFEGGVARTKSGWQRSEKSTLHYSRLGRFEEIKRKSGRRGRVVSNGVEKNTEGDGLAGLRQPGGGESTVGNRELQVFIGLYGSCCPRIFSAEGEQILRLHID
jgi:hypothetical protein